MTATPKPPHLAQNSYTLTCVWRLLNGWLMAGGLLVVMASSVQAAPNPSAQMPQTTQVAAPSSLANTANAAFLAAFSAKNQTIAHLAGQFEQSKTIAVLPMPIRSSGVFEFTQGQGVVWETQEPIQNRIHLTAQGIYTQTADGNSETLQNQDNKSQDSKSQGAGLVASIFMGVIAGDLTQLTRFFTLEANTQGEQWQLVLTPNTPNLAAYIHQIRLDGHEFTEQLHIAETNGDTTDIRFTTTQVKRVPNPKAAP